MKNAALLYSCCWGRVSSTTLQLWLLLAISRTVNKVYVLFWPRKTTSFFKRDLISTVWAMLSVRFSTNQKGESVVSSQKSYICPCLSGNFSKNFLLSIYRLFSLYTATWARAHSPSSKWACSCDSTPLTRPLSTWAPWWWTRRDRQWLWSRQRAAWDDLRTICWHLKKSDFDTKIRSKFAPLLHSKNQIWATYSVSPK